MNILEQLQNNPQLQEMLSNPKTFETINVIQQKLATGEISADTNKLLLQASQMMQTEDISKVADKLVSNVSNIIEANSDELIQSENSIEDYVPEVGEHIYVLRPADTSTETTGVELELNYTHHGIYIGNNEVIHYLAEECRVDSLETFANGYKIRLNKNTPTTYSTEEIIKRASSRLGEKEYNLVSNNCEHFCHWCRCDKS